MDPVVEIPEWTEALSVGVDIIDEDHQAFFRLPALLKEIDLEDADSSDMLLETVLNILEEYVEGHFLREQRALAAVNFPDLAEHIAAHDRFAAKVGDIIRDFRNGDRSQISQLGSLVVSWIVNHIMTMDKQYCGILSNDNVDNRPLVYLMEDGDAEDPDKSV